MGQFLSKSKNEGSCMSRCGRGENELEQNLRIHWADNGINRMKNNDDTKWIKSYTERRS
jgi:hypothetical protein